MAQALGRVCRGRTVSSSHVSRWDETVIESAEEAKRFWAQAPMSVLYGMMDTPRWAWVEWLRVAAGVVTTPGSVWEPGCGIGVLTEVLPEGCTYYGCDLNDAYVADAIERYAAPGIRFEARDLEDVLRAGEEFDWIVVTSLFGMFPEAETYRLIQGLWPAARKGMSVTTMNKRLMPKHRMMRHEFTSHDPDELLAVDLPGAEKELHHGREYTRFRGHHWSRGLALYARRANVRASRAS
jgi:hypothetical protein